jgi:hypothetical protein
MALIDLMVFLIGRGAARVMTICLESRTRTPAPTCGGRR